MIYGSLNEISQNNLLYYRSAMGSQYSHFTEKGRESALSMLEFWIYTIAETEDIHLDQRAKQMVINNLKGE